MEGNVAGGEAILGRNNDTTARHLILNNKERANNWSFAGQKHDKNSLNEPISMETPCFSHMLALHMPLSSLCVTINREFDLTHLSQNLIQASQKMSKKNMASKYPPVRSISLPSRPHPSTVKIEEELSKLKFLEESSRLASGSICRSLSGLEDLYIYIDDLLNMASTQQVLSQYQREKCIDDLLDVSVKLLDICGITRDTMLQIKEHVQALHSAVRRRKGDSSIKNSIASYTCFRKKMKKDAKKFIAALKQMNNKLVVSSLIDQNYHLLAIIRVLREVNAVTSSIFQSLLLFLSASGSKPNQSGWSLVSKLMHKGAIACEDKQEIVNELESVDVTLCCHDIEKIQHLQTSLKAMEISIEGLEKYLESLFRKLIRTRASLLNILSQ